MRTKIQRINSKFQAAYDKGLKGIPDPNGLIQVLDSDYKLIDYKKDVDPVRDKMDANRHTIQGWEDAAKAKGSLIGRFLSEPMGDGYGIYVIIKENAKTVKVQVCRNVGDDWTPWGEFANLNKANVIAELKMRDKPNNIFAPETVI